MSEGEKSYSKFQWFFLVIFIPVMFAVVLFGVILSLLGFDVVNQAKQLGSNIPYVSNVFSEKEEETELEEIDPTIELEQTVLEQEAELEQLRSDIEQKQAELETIELEQEQQQRLVQEEESAKLQEMLEEIGEIYELMDAERAALILSQLNTSEAVRHLQQVQVETRAEILEVMEEETAVELMKQLSSIE